MSDVTELRAFELLAAAAGPGAAIKMVRFFGPAKLYVPRKLGAEHILVRLLGEVEAGWLSAELGGETVWVPALELKSLRQAGRLRAERHRPKSVTTISDNPSVSDRHRRRLAATLLTLEGHRADLTE